MGVGAAVGAEAPASCAAAEVECALAATAPAAATSSTAAARPPTMPARDRGFAGVELSFVTAIAPERTDGDIVEFCSAGLGWAIAGWGRAIDTVPDLGAARSAWHSPPRPMHHAEILGR